MSKRGSNSRCKLRKHIQQALAGVCLGAGLLAAPVYAETFMVTNANDSGPGSVRQAILDANATPISGSSYHVIKSDASLEDDVLILNSPLPVIVGAIELDVDFANTRDNRITTPITVIGNGRFYTNAIVNGVLTVNDNANVRWFNSALGDLDDRDLTIATINDNSSVEFDSMAMRGDVIVNDNATLDWRFGTAWGDVITGDNAKADISYVDVIYGMLAANGNSRITFEDGEIYENTELEHLVVANNNAQITIEDALVNGTIQANDHSFIRINGDWLPSQNSEYVPAIQNAIANNQATIHLHNTSIAGDATFNDASILRSSGDSSISGTTTLGANTVFAPDVMNGPLSLNGLDGGNWELRPWFQESDLSSPIEVGEENGHTVLAFSDLKGTLNSTLVSPLDFGAYYTSMTSTSVTIDPVTTITRTYGNITLYLKSNQVNLKKLPGSENAHAIGGYLSSYFNSTQTPDGDLDFSALQSSDAPTRLNDMTFNAIVNASQSGNLNQLDQLGWDVYSTHNAQSYWNQKSFVESIAANLHNPIYQDSGTAAENPLYKGLTGNASATNTQLASLRQAMVPAAVGYAVNGNGGKSSSVWAAYNGNHQSTDADSGVGSRDWSSSTNGYTVGFTNGGDKFSWGVAAGHQDSDLNFTGGNGEQEGWNMGLYGSWQSKSTYLTGILGYGKYDNDIYDGDISSFDTKATSASLEIGKHLSDDKKGGFTPYASVLWTKIKQDDASGGEGLVLKNGSNNIFTTELGVRYNHRMFDKSDSLKGGWTAGLSWLHQGGDTGLPVNVGFAGVDGSAAIKSTPLAGNSLRVQLGAYGRIHGNLIGFAGYQGTFGSSQKINAVNAGIGYQF